MDIETGDGRGVLVGDIVPLAEVDDLLLRDHSGLFAGLHQVDFIGHDDPAELARRSFVDLPEPALQVPERFAVGQVEHHDGTLTFPVV